MIHWRTPSRAVALMFAIIGVALSSPVFAAASQEGRFLYVATPGIRNYLEYGGHGVLVYDIDRGHAFVRRIPFAGLDAQGKPLNVKGICASAVTGRLYVSTLSTLTCFDLTTDQVLWEKSYDKGCDRMSITPDGKTIYLPSFEKETWHVVDAMDGHVVTELTLNSRAHNTIVGPNGREAYLAGLGSPLLGVADVSSQTVTRKIGPFGSAIRPFTINGQQTRVYVNVNDLLGFEVGDLQTGQVLERVEVSGFSKGPVKRHGCPSHGIALTLDEKELWLADAANSKIHLFDLTAKHPKQIASIEVRDQPGWITFGIDGRYVYPSTGDVIDAHTRKIIATLKDEKGEPVQSEKLLEIDFKAGRPITAGNQFAIGGAR